jgi:hypothetical protein
MGKKVITVFYYQRFTEGYDHVWKKICHFKKCFKCFSTAEQGFEILMGLLAQLQYLLYDQQ